MAVGSMAWLLATALLLVGSGPSSTEAPSRASAREVTRVVVKKAAHVMELRAGDRVLRAYRVAIGPGGAGVKGREGDAITPVGRYHVVSRAPSRYHVFLRLDYPNADDRARFARRRAAGELPRTASIGGDVGIHGAPPQPEWKARHKEVDWTLGCVAVDDAEIDEVAALVRDGTEVLIED